MELPHPAEGSVGSLIGQVIFARLLRDLLAFGATVRGIRNLHSKIFVFDSLRAIVTSANLTDAALDRNHEFGMLAAEEPAVLDACKGYFEDLWARGGPDLRADSIKAWEDEVSRYRISVGKALQQNPRLPDFGADAGVVPGPKVNLAPAIENAQDAFVKFLGQSNNRQPIEHSTIEEIDRSWCHKVLSYPSGRRPTGVIDAALMFIGRLTRDPNDIRIFGRGIAIRHTPVRDDATPNDIASRNFFRTWPHFIRVSDAEFVAGSMRNGVSLNELMNELQFNSFESTERNKRRESGNIDPRRAYMQQPAVKLSETGRLWLNERLQQKFDAFGKVPQESLDKLASPELKGLVAPVQV